MTARTYPMWSVTVLVAQAQNPTGVTELTVDIDAPDELTAEQDATAMLFYGDGWEVLTVQSVVPLG